MVDVDAQLQVLARNVRALREQRGESQEEAAKGAGLHRTYLNRVERGHVNVTVGTLVRLAAHYGVRPGELFDN